MTQTSSSLDPASAEHLSVYSIEPWRQKLNRVVTIKDMGRLGLVALVGARV